MDIFDNEEGKTRLIITIRIMLAAIFWLLARFVLNGSFQTAAFALAYLIAGYDIVTEALEKLITFKWTSEELLMTVASLTAFFTGEGEESVMVMLLYQLGELLTDIAVSRSQKNIEQLLAQKKEKVHWLLDGQVIDIDAERIEPGMLLQVNPGENIIVKGTVKEGSSLIDMTALNEEDKTLREINVGDELVIGAINISETLIIEVEEGYETTSSARINEVVETCRNDSGSTEGTLNKFIRFYTPFVMITAVLIAVFAPLLTKINYRESVHIACTLLVISCPCALVISIPLAFFCGVGNAGKKGILVKGAEYLEALYRFDYLGLEKKKLLTNGQYEVGTIVSEMEEDKFMKICASMVKDLDGPYYKAIADKYGEDREYSIIRNLNTDNGNGIKARIGNKDYFLGSYEYICENTADKPEEKEGNVLCLATRKENLGYLVFSEQVIDSTADVIRELKRNNVSQIKVFSGEKSAENSICDKVDGIDKIFGEATEEVKIADITEAKKKGMTTAFIGNSGDDVAVMKAADVGIALSEISPEKVISGSDVVLMSSDLSLLLTGRIIARKTVGIVKQNIWFIIGCKLLFIIMSLMGSLPMWMAVFADVGVTLITVLNSARLLRIK